MRTWKRISAALAASAVALTLAACSSGDSSGSGDAASGDGSDTGSSGLEFPVAESVDLTDSPTFDAATAAGTIRIGVKEDQPGLGYLDAITGERTGFDIDIARWIAADLGFSDDQIEFQTIPSANREQSIVNGDIDLYVGTYSITDKRKDQIGFAGPYFITGQGLLVAADNTDITADADLAGTTVCSATGSTPIQNIRDNYPDTETVEFDTYSQCVDALKDGSVDAVTTDQAILIGYAAQEPDALKVVGEPFSEEKYGVGLPKDDAALRHYINAIFTDGGDTWQEIFDANLGSSGITVEQPAVDDYE